MQAWQAWMLKHKHWIDYTSESNWQIQSRNKRTQKKSPERKTSKINHGLWFAWWKDDQKCFVYSINLPSVGLVLAFFANYLLAFFRCRLVLENYSVLGQLPRAHTPDLIFVVVVLHHFTLHACALFFYWILFYCSTFSTFNSEHNFVLIRLLLKVFRSNCGTSFYPLFIQFSRILTGSYFQCTANLTDNSIRWLSSVVVNHEKLFSRRLNNHK